MWKERKKLAKIFRFNRCVLISVLSALREVGSENRRLRGHN
jgi:hypothetical protein